MTVIEAIGIFGTIVFAVSGSLAACRLKMDIIGFILLGTVTAIGGGTVRDLLLGLPVFWVVDPNQLFICVASSLITYFVVPESIGRTKAIVWSDALGLCAFAVQGAHTALNHGVHESVAIVMGVLTAVGGGVIRDMLSGVVPFIMRGELYASTALAGSAVFVLIISWGLPGQYAELAGFGVTFVTRAAAIVFNIEMGPPGEFIRLRRGDKDQN